MGWVDGMGGDKMGRYLHTQEGAGGYMCIQYADVPFLVGYMNDVWVGKWDLMEAWM